MWGLSFFIFPLFSCRNQHYMVSISLLRPLGPFILPITHASPHYIAVKATTCCGRWLQPSVYSPLILTLVLNSMGYTPVPLCFVCFVFFCVFHIGKRGPSVDSTSWTSPSKPSAHLRQHEQDVHEEKRPVTGYIISLLLLDRTQSCKKKIRWSKGRNLTSSTWIQNTL